MNPIPDDNDRLDRLADAVEAFLDHESQREREGPSAHETRADFFARHDQLRDLLEPMFGVDPDGSPKDSDHDETEARYLGDYRLDREVGRGGMGVVYEACHIPLGRRVALKVLPAHLTLAPQRIERFRREAAAAAKLTHPGIVPVYDVGECDGTYYFAMEFVEGRNLAEAMRDGSGHGLGVVADTSLAAEAAEIVERVALALDYAHSRGVLHRDVKPHNILIGVDGAVRLVDFGLARDEDRHSLTQTGDFAGTPHYASPEQVAGARDMDGRADVFSLGVVLYEILAGSRPFEGATGQQVLEAIRVREPRSLRRLNPRVPRDLEVICHKALEKQRHRRYQSAQEFAQDLRRFLRLEPIAVRPPSSTTRLMKLVQRNKLATTAVLLASVLVVGTPSVMWQSAHALAVATKEHLDIAHRLLSESADLIDQSGLASRPRHERLYLERLRRIANLNAELLADDATSPKLLSVAARISERMGVGHARLSENEAALVHGNRAVEIFADLDRRFPDEVEYRRGLSSALQARGVLRRDMGSFDAAAADLDESIAIATELEERASDPTDRSRLCAQLAMTHHSRAVLLVRDRAASRAESSVENRAEAEFEKSLEFWNEIPDYLSTDLTAARHRTRTHTRFGFLLLQSERLEEAKKHFEISNRALGRLLEVDRESPLLRSPYAENLRGLAEVHRRIGDRPEVVGILRRAIPLHEELAADYPGLRDYAYNLAMIRWHLAELIADRPSGQQEAFTLLTDALPVAEKLHDQHPESYSYERLCSHASHLYARLLEKQRTTKVTEAIVAYRKAVDRLEKFVKKPARMGNPQCELARATGRLGYWQMRIGNLDRARDCVERAIELEAVAHRENQDSPHFLSIQRANHRVLLRILVRGKFYTETEALLERAEFAGDTAAEKVTASRTLAMCASAVKRDEGLEGVRREALFERFARAAIERLDRALELGCEFDTLAQYPELAPLRTRADFVALRKRRQR